MKMEKLLSEANSGAGAQSFYLIDFQLIGDIAETEEWANCSKILGR